MVAGIRINQKQCSGFTLIEILLVVVIIGIMTVVGANIINSQSPERAIMDQASRFEAELNYLCDLSVLENRAHGIEWTEKGRYWLTYQLGDWLIKENRTNTEHLPFDQAVLLQGRTQILAPESEEMPHVICQTDGSFNAFEIRWYINKEDRSTTYYSLKSETQWQLRGDWVES